MLLATYSSDLGSESASSTRLQSRREDRLEDLVQPGPGRRPNYHWWALIRAAINSSPEAKLTLQGIYDSLSAQFPCFEPEDDLWKNAVRHNLSVKPCFVREKADFEKGFWRVDHNMDPNRRRLHGRKGMRTAKQSFSERVVESNFLHAQSFADALIEPSDDGMTDPILKRGFALGFDRECSRAIRSALAELLIDAQYAPMARQEADNLKVSYYQELLDNFPSLPDKSFEYVGETSEAVEPVLSENGNTMIAEASRIVYSVLHEKQSLLPLPVGMGTKAMQSSLAEKPEISVAEALRAILLSRAGYPLSIEELLEALRVSHPYYQYSLSDQWKNTARTVLASHECFQSTQGDNASEMWTVDEDVSVFQKIARPLPALNVNIIRAADVPMQLAAIVGRKEGL